MAQEPTTGASAADAARLSDTQSNREAGTQARWRLRNWRLPTKFAVLLLIPIALALVLGGLRVGAAAADAARLSAVQRQVALGQQAAAVTHALQKERHLLAAYLATDATAERTAVQAQITDVDAEIAELFAVAPAPEELTPETGAAYATARVQLQALPALREQVLVPNAVADIAVGRYSDRINGLLQLTRVAFTGADPSLREVAASAQAIAAAKEEVSVQHAVLLAASFSGDLLGFQQQFLSESDTRFDSAIAAFDDSSDGATSQLYLSTVAGPAVTNRERLLNVTLTLARSANPAPIPSAEWDAAAGETAELMRQVEEQLVGRIAEETAALRNDARGEAIRDGIVIALLIFTTLTVLVAVARSVMRPLAALRTAAFDIAERQLPAEVEQLQASSGQAADVVMEPVPVDTREDIGEVARAFDAVHGVALRLAGEQAALRVNVNAMFVNLSRRSQALVERQLAVIDELEGSERDPDHLAQLFSLDHLATRMRRNNENLLVLAGVELRQRAGEPVPVFDVLRAAAGEIADYRRVRVRPESPGSVRGPVVDDLVHLVAELLDNATAFSPPESTVTVRSGLGRDGRLLIEIVDQGVGLSAQQREAINARLAEPPRVDVSAARKMGLFVVGRLALRHGITVRLSCPEDAPGVSAAVIVPASLIERAAAAQRRTPTVEVPAASGGLFTAAQVASPSDDILFGELPASTDADPSSPIFDEMVSAWFRERRPPAGTRNAGRRSSPVSEQDWASVADQGWLAAEGLAQDGGSDELTAAGLPRRRPGALLVPGTADVAEPAHSPPPAPARHAEAVRGRLAGYQRGVREGRASAGQRSGRHSAPVAAQPSELPNGHGSEGRA